MQVHPQFLIDLEWKKYLLYGKVEYNKLDCLNPLIESDLTCAPTQDCSKFICENIADGTLVTKGEVFKKTWRLQNTGSITWKDRWLVCQDLDVNDIFNSHPSFSTLNDIKSFQLEPKINKVPIDLTLPNDTVDISVSFTAPDIPCVTMSYWKMTNSDGSFCFPDTLGIYTLVRVI